MQARSLFRPMSGQVLATVRPHQLCWGDWEVGTAISCTKCSHVAGLIHMTDRSSLTVVSLHAAVLQKLTCMIINTGYNQELPSAAKWSGSS